MDLLVFHIDNPGGENHGYLRVGGNLRPDGQVRSWRDVKQVPGWFGAEDQGGDICITELDGDGRSEAIVVHIDNPAGENRGYYRVGKRLNAAGEATRGWSEPKLIPGWFGAEDQGAGAAVADIDRDGRPDLLVFHIDNPAGENRGYYRIGWRLNAAGDVTGGWTSPTLVPGWFGAEDQGAGVALGDIDRDGRLDLLVFHIDNPAGENHGYYRVGWGLDAAGRATRGWSPVKAVPGWFGSEDQGGGVSLADVDRDGRLDLLVFHIDNPEGENRGYYRVGYRLSNSGDVTDRWTEPTLIPGWFGSEDQGGGIAVRR